jgi:hypothetical protein
MTKRLYVLEFTYRAYVEAEDSWEAQEYVSEIQSDAIDPDSTDVYEVHPGENPLGWDKECLVYGTEDDVKFGEWFEKNNVQ